MTKTISFYPAPGSAAFPAVTTDQVHPMPDIPPFALTSDVSAEDFAASMAFLGTRHGTNPCLTVRWLSDGTTLGVIQFCELEHHMGVHAHRMVNPDGSVTTWRS